MDGMSERVRTLAARFESAPYNRRLGGRVEAGSADAVRIRVPSPIGSWSPRDAVLASCRSSV